MQRYKKNAFYARNGSKSPLCLLDTNYTVIICFCFNLEIVLRNVEPVTTACSRSSGNESLASRTNIAYY